ncbi:hypothetical protein EUGRSUZ_F02702 [Eucalyptus grandis]|uniref:Uncharacterized protein n=2 Tax=Eucalyptus grandis TaxID=71139 RepID=A0ACC3KIC2_EUCGR|nr:hypothetical protein EUGRSUZ_F02702 [Eucalyptus grandis]
MHTPDYQGSHAGRSILSLRRDQAAPAMDPHHRDAAAAAPELELEAFQRQVADRLVDLSSASADELLSLAWVRKLLDAFLCCQEEFGAILSNNKANVARSPAAERLLAEFHERSVKALDVCNAVRDGIEQITQWQKLLEIVMPSSIWAIAMLDEKDSSTTIGHRNRSFGRNNASRDPRSIGHFRSLSWSVSRSWSAAKQIQAIGNNLNAPRGNEIAATNGLAVPIFTMGMVLLFVMWALVAAIPCQDRGLQVHFSVPRQFIWAAPILSLHDRIMEEWKKRERKNACGLMREIYQIEKCSRVMSEMVDSVNFPLTEEKEAEVRQRVQELGQVFEVVNEGLDPLERQVREVFHRIVRSRTEGGSSSST